MENDSVEKTITQLIALLESDPGLRERLMEDIDEASEGVNISFVLGATKTFLAGSLLPLALLHGVKMLSEYSTCCTTYGIGC